MRLSAGIQATTLVIVAATCGAAHAETIRCRPIARVPVVIRAPGIYCLVADISANLASGTAITINANAVILDLNGHTLSNFAAGETTQAVGISGSQRQAVTVKNGTIAGFAYAVYLTGAPPYTVSQANVIEGIRAYRNTTGGITIGGRGCIVRGNQVVATGIAPTGNNSAFGIHVFGPANRVMDNDVVTVIAGDFGVSEGIFFGDGTDACLAVGNRISDTFDGLIMTQASTKYRDNLTTRVGRPYAGGTDAGNNN